MTHEDKSSELDKDTLLQTQLLARHLHSMNIPPTEAAKLIRQYLADEGGATMSADEYIKSVIEPERPE